MKTLLVNYTSEKKFNKISNNLIIQYGKSRNFYEGEQAYEIQILPISYTNNYIACNTVVTSKDFSGNAYSPSISILDKTSFQSIHNGARTGFHTWITIGY